MGDILHTSEITNYLKKFKHFYGCFSKSSLKNKNYILDLDKCDKLSLKSIIINNDKEHWVALILLNNICLYFDPDYNGAICEEILLFLQKRYKCIIANTQKIQHSESYICAKYCIAFILFVNSKKSYMSFLNKFDYKNTKKNDIIVNNLLKK